MKHVNHKVLLMALAATSILSAASCKKENNSGGGNVDPVAEGRFIIAAAPTAAGSEGVADYLLTAKDLESGTISTEGNGLEQDGTYRYYTTSGSKFYSLLYGQGNPGAVTIYELDGNGELSKLSNFQSENAHAFTPVGDDILTIKSARTATSPIAHWYRISTQSNTIVAEGQYDALQLAGNGELAHPSWVTPVGSKIFMPYFCIKATSEGGWTTDYPDSSWIAVFSYPSMTLEKVIKDNRTSSIGLYYENGLIVHENGDVYGFSPSNTVGKANGEEVFNSTKPSSIVRIKAGTTEFDQSYIYDIEAASNGYYISGWLYAGNGLAIAAMNSKSEKIQWQAANRLAIVDLANSKFTWVSGLPSASEVSQFSMTNYADGKGNGYIGITTKDNKSFVYKINAASASATKGVEVEGGIITSIQWLAAPKK